MVLKSSATAAELFLLDLLHVAPQVFDERTGAAKTKTLLRLPGTLPQRREGKTFSIRGAAQRS